MPNTTARQGSPVKAWGERYIAARSCKLNHLPPSLTTPPTYQRGFTLVELVVTIALLAILTTLAIPSFSEVLRQWRRDSATRALLISLQIARSEAIKSSRRMVVCPSTNGTSCAASTEWRNGWIVFVDDGATDQTYDAGERVINVTSGQSGVATLASSGGVQVMQFLPNGLMASGTTTFTVTPSGASASTKVDKIAVSRVGRVTITTELP